MEISSITTKNEKYSLFSNCENQNSRPTGVSLESVDTLQQEIISDKNASNTQLRLPAGLKNKQLSAILSEWIASNYTEVKNNINCSKWEIIMQNKLNSLNKNNAWEIIDKPEKIKKIIKNGFTLSRKMNLEK